MNGLQAEERPRQIEAEQLKLLYAQVPIAFVVSVVNATILVFFLRTEVPVPTLVTWWTLLVGIYCARLTLMSRYRQAEPGVAETRQWRSRFLIGAASAGCGWGATGIFLFPSQSLPHQIFLVFIIGGMAIGAITSMAAVKQVYLAFILPLTLPVICRFLFQQEGLFFAMGLLSLIFVAGIVAMASQFNTMIVESLALGFEKRDLLESNETLQQAHNILEQRVRERTTALQQEVNERVRSEAHARAMLQAIPDTVFRATQEGIFLDYNPRDMFRSLASPSFFVGRKFADIVPTGIAKATLEAVGQALQTGETQVYEYPLMIQGQTRNYEVRLAVSGPNEVVGIVRDITQRKEIERLKDDLVSTVSHELRTPLTSIRGFTELMLTRTFPPEKQQDILAIMQGEAVRLTNLINDFLDLRRMEAGQAVYQFASVQLDPLFQRSLAPFLSANGNHTFRVELAETLPTATADADRIQQVLTNFLSNAVKFSPAGGEIVLGADSQEHELVVWIKDQGIGIAPEILPKVFDRFFRVESSMTRAIGGTGLGLALVKEIITIHKGRVWAESILGQGSTFFFTLPLSDELQASLGQVRVSDRQF